MPTRCVFLARGVTDRLGLSRDVKGVFALSKLPVAVRVCSRPPLGLWSYGPTFRLVTGAHTRTRLGCLHAARVIVGSWWWGMSG